MSQHVGRVAVSLGALAVMLVLVAAAGGVRSGSSAGSVRPLGLRVVGDVVAVLVALLLIASLSGWVAVLGSRRRRRRRQDGVGPALPPLWGRLVAVVVPFALVALALGVLVGGRRAGLWDPAPAGLRLPGLSGGRSSPADPVASIHWPAVAIVVLVAVLGVAGALILDRRRPDRTFVSVVSAGDDLAALRAVGLEELGREPDPRRAVIRAYAAMCELLALSGRPRQPSETPYEFLARVLVGLGASAVAARRLTELFERAKFSDHPITGAFKDEAIDAVRGLQAVVAA